MIVTVSCQNKSIAWDRQKHSCRIGRDGFIEQARGREGDGKTPLGDYKIRFGFYRADRLPAPPPGQVHFWQMSKNDGWCDDVNSAAYNRLVRLPFSGSHEKLWRDDGAYDIVLVMNHNDSPPQIGVGSAVFMHISQVDDRQTLGCIAFSPDVMIKLLQNICPASIIRVIG